jgi:beta-galactosidase
MTRIQSLAIGVLAGAGCSLAFSSLATANDAMFPAATATAASIGWKNNYFTVNGKPTVINAGEIHYARVPRELWHERLVKMKRAGFNTVSTYVFWNAQEPASGVFEMGDNLDLDAWLTEIEAVGLYAIVRPGPYNCAEWLAGGIPQWITSYDYRAPLGEESQLRQGYFAVRRPAAFTRARRAEAGRPERPATRAEAAQAAAVAARAAEA